MIEPPRSTATSWRMKNRRADEIPRKDPPEPICFCRSGAAQRKVLGTSAEIINGGLEGFLDRRRWRWPKS